ncbi:MAG: sodium:solute symporter family transporter [Brevinema sp.]
MAHWDLLEWGILLSYLLVFFSIGFFFSTKKRNDVYFIGTINTPNWVKGLSIYITALSSISFVVITSNIFLHGWIFAMGILGVIPLLFFIAHFIIPFIQKLPYISIYEFLEYRFNYSIRALASAIFIIFHIFRIGIVIFIPTLAMIEVLPNMNPIVLILFMGILCIIYTTVGGFEAVVWSDALQTFILISGAVSVILFGFLSVPKGINPFEVLYLDGKIFTASNFSFNPKITTLWWLLLGGFFGSLYQYMSSQDIVQRYGSKLNNIHESKKILLMQAPLMLVSVFIFTGMGSAIYLFYKYSGFSAPILSNNNAILPYFIMHHLPKGLSALMIAAIFSVAQSTVSSSINSISTCTVMDFIVPFNKSITDQQKIKIAKIVSIISGLLGTLLAMDLMLSEANDMYLLFNGILGLLGGPISGIFLVAIFFPKGDSKVAWAGFICSSLCSLYIANPHNILNVIPYYTQPKIFEFLFAPLILAISLSSSYIFYCLQCLNNKITETN